MKGAMVVAHGTKYGTLYTTAGCINMDAVAEGASDSCLWHNMSTKGMKMLVSKGALEGLNSVDIGLCESCVMGKEKRVSFTKTPREPKKVRLEMVHTNVWRPSQYHHSEDPDSMLPSLMISAGRYVFTF